MSLFSDILFSEKSDDNFPVSETPAPEISFPIDRDQLRALKKQWLAKAVQSREIPMKCRQCSRLWLKYDGDTCMEYTTGKTRKPPLPVFRAVRTCQGPHQELSI